MHVILDHLVKGRLSCVFNPVVQDTTIVCETSSIVVVHLRVSSCRFFFFLFVCVCVWGGGGGL